MLSSNSCSPCHIFESREGFAEKLSAEDLKDVLLWASSLTPANPEIIFLAGADDPIEQSITSALDEVAEHVVTPLMPLEEQQQKGIPFSPEQTVIARSLRHAVATADSIAGRPAVIHVEPSEIGILSGSLLSVQESFGSVTIRLRNLDLLDENDLASYTRELAVIAESSLMKNAMGAGRKVGVMNLSILAPSSDTAGACPAGRDFAVVGPDRGLYACPAFYHAGPEYRLGSARRAGADTGEATANPWTCNTNGSKQVPRCLFLRLTHPNGEEQMCRMREAESRASRQFLRRVTKSGYLFDCLRTLRNADCQSDSRREGGEDLAADLHLHDVKFSEFISALDDLKYAAQASLEQSPQGFKLDSVLNRWRESPAIPPNSRRGIFRRRVAEILTGLTQLRHICPMVESSSGGGEGRENENDRQPRPSIPQASYEKIESLQNVHPQPIPQGELEKIRTLYHARLGWSFLYESTAADVEAGFACEPELSIIRSELEIILRKTSEWFKTIQQRDKWPSRDGWIWEIDFASGHAVHKRQRPSTTEPQRYTKASVPTETEVMSLGSTDFDIIRRLLEKREAAADLVRRLFTLQSENRCTIGRLRAAARKVGAADKNVRDWFYAMAELYRWPEPQDQNSMYRFDVAERKVYIANRRRPTLP